MAKKIALWGFVFAVFGFYSAQVLSQAYAGPEIAVAYAKTIEHDQDKKEKDTKNETNQNEKKNKHSIYVVAMPDQNPFIRILERLHMRAEKERELCEVTEEQFGELDSLLDFDFEDLDVHGHTVKIATPHGGHLSPGHLAKMQVHCLKLSVLERLILVISAHVS